MKVAAIAVLVMLLSAPIAGAQLQTGNPDADSAAAARGAWIRANRALREGDTALALREVAHAARAWPRQPAYVWGLAVVSARAGDTASMRRALVAYADLGLGRDVKRETLFAKHAAMPGFAELAARHDENRRALGRSRTVHTVPDSSLWPEGLDHDPRSGRYYLTSIAHGTVIEIGPDGSTRDIIARNSPGIGSILATRVNASRGVLWATTTGMPGKIGYSPGDSSIAALLRISLRDGTVERRWDLPVRNGGHVLGDLSIGPSGDLWFTDSNEPVVYRLRDGADSLETFRSPLFRSLQGSAPAPDRASVYLADYSHGLLRLDVASGAVTRLADPPVGTSLGVDGIALYKNSIIAVQNGIGAPRIARMRLDATGTRIMAIEVLDRGGEIIEPTTGVVVGDEFVYIANSLWNQVGNDGRLTPDAKPLPPRLAAVKLVN